MSDDCLTFEDSLRIDMVSLDRSEIHVCMYTVIVMNGKHENARNTEHAGLP